MTTKKDIVRNNIAELRKNRGYSQIEFAEMVGVRHWWLCEVENDKAQPSLSLSMRIADKLGVTLDDIFLK